MAAASIAILVNSQAGKGRANQVAGFLQVTLTQKNIPFKIFIDNWHTELINFKEVWIVGGDGTLNYFLNKFPDCSIPIAIFKGGTGNDIAWKLYGDLSDQQHVDVVLQSLPKLLDAGLCNEKIFINGIGIGFDGEVLKSIKAIRFIGGHFGYLIAVIGKIFSFNEYCFAINVDGKRMSGKYLLAMVFNSSRTGGGFHVSPTALLNDGLLNILLCKPLTIFQRLRYLPVIEKGNHLNLPFIEHSLVKRITIESNAVLPAQCDGDLIFASRFEVKILPGKYLFKY